MDNDVMYLELDVHLTKDNVVVIMHDYDLSRVCNNDQANGRKFIGEFNYDELPPFRGIFTTGLVQELTYTCPD